jgi:hypothetical protein
VPAEEGDAVRRRIRLLLAGGRDPRAAGAARHGRHEPVLIGAHRLRGDGRQVGSVGARLVAVDLLEPEDVGVERGDRLREDVDVDEVVHRVAAVQDVEGRDAHPHVGTPRPAPGTGVR